MRLLSPKREIGPHSIPTDILQLIKCNIAKLLYKIVNLSFSTGVYSDKLKIANVLPMFKDKGSRLQYCKYRPISLSSNINKICKNIMFKAL